MWQEGVGQYYNSLYWIFVINNKLSLQLERQARSKILFYYLWLNKKTSPPQEYRAPLLTLLHAPIICFVHPSSGTYKKTLKSKAKNKNTFCSSQVSEGEKILASCTYEQKHLRRSPWVAGDVVWTPHGRSVCSIRPERCRADPPSMLRSWPAAAALKFLSNTPREAARTCVQQQPLRWLDRVGKREKPPAPLSPHFRPGTRAFYVFNTWCAHGNEHVWRMRTTRPPSTLRSLRGFCGQSAFPAAALHYSVAATRRSTFAEFRVKNWFLSRREEKRFLFLTTSGEKGFCSHQRQRFVYFSGNRGVGETHTALHSRQKNGRAEMHSFCAFFLFWRFHSA